MKLHEHDNKPCSIAQALSVIGDSWTLLILRNAFLGTKRFDSFQQELGLTRHLLTDRLNKLVDNEILSKVPVANYKSRFEYRLTAKGRALSTLFIAMGNWANDWLFDPDEAPMSYAHKGCQGEVRVERQCKTCDETLMGNEIEIVHNKEVEALKSELCEEDLIKKLGFLPRR